MVMNLRLSMMVCSCQSFDLESLTWSYSLARAIVSNDECKRGGEVDGALIIRIEGSNSTTSSEEHIPWKRRPHTPKLSVPGSSLHRSIVSGVNTRQTGSLTPGNCQYETDAMVDSTYMMG